VDRDEVGAGRRLLASEVLAGHEEAPAESGTRVGPAYASTLRTAVHVLTAPTREDAAGAFRPW